MSEKVEVGSLDRRNVDKRMLERQPLLSETKVFAFRIVFAYGIIFVVDPESLAAP